MPSRPTWLFDSPLLRRALADVNLPAVPGIVRAACGVPQRDLAAMAGWSEAVLSYYARGLRDGMYDIRTVLQFADAVGMPRRALLPLVLADTDTGPVQCSRDNTGDEFPEEVSAAADSTGQAGSAPAAMAPRGAFGPHARYWQACTDALYAQGRSVSGTVLLPLALQQWRRARLAAREAGHGEAGPRLLTAAGDLALCSGWLAVDAVQLTLARELTEDGREMAARSGDAMLGVHVLEAQSMVHAELAGAGQGRGHARQALRLAFQAQDKGRYLPVPRLHALIALRHAAAASLLGDRAGFQRAVGQARRELDQDRGEQVPSARLRGVDDATVTVAEAAGWLELGEPARSAALYRQALSAVLSPHDRAGCGAGLADALIRLGDRQDAVTAAVGALPGRGEGSVSLRHLSRLRRVRQSVDGTEGAAEFRERFDAAERALPSPVNQLGSLS